ncbi:MAG: SRPBCC family protein [Acidimicrobiales bacterium]
MGLSISTLHVRRSIFINASPSVVWRSFEDQASVMAWLDAGHTVHSFDPQVGGVVEMSIPSDGGRVFFGGEVLVVDPERELSLQVQWKDSPAWPVPMFWTFRLTSLYDGTLVELFHHGFERLGVSAADQLEDYEGGWTIQHLTGLRALAEA